MELFLQFGLILIFSLLGEALHALIPLPVPAGIYGFLLLFIALCTKVIKLEKIRRAADLMVAFMPVLFVPAAAGLMTQGPSLRQLWLPLTIAICAGTPLVMAASGLVCQAVIRRKEARK